MSYKLHNCGIPEKGQVNGIVKGVYDECTMRVEYNAVYISRGKIIVCGYEIEIDGREVVGIPSDWASGDLSLVGALTVQNGKAVEFKLSLRQGGTLRQDDVHGKGYGIYEVLLATVTCSNGVLHIKREIEILSDNFEFDKSEYKSKAVSGQVLHINDAKRGYLKNLSLLGYSQGVLPNRLSCVPSRFKVVTQSVNLYDYKSAKIVQKGEVPSGNYVNAVKVVGELKEIDNGFRALSLREKGGNFFTNGYIEFFVGHVEKGNYCISADIFVHEAWEDNNECICFFQAFKDDTDLGYTMRSFNLGETVRGEARYIVEEEGDLRVRFYFSGLEISMSNIQVEKGDNFTQYTSYFKSEKDITLLDKDGNAQQLYGINDCQDEIFYEDGKYKLIRRIKVGGHEVGGDMKDYCYYYDGSTLEFKYHETSPSVSAFMEEGIIIYPTKNPEIIELDQDGVSGLKSIELGPVGLTVEGKSGDSYDVESPVICAEYEVNPFWAIEALQAEIESLKERIKALEG